MEIVKHTTLGIQLQRGDQEWQQTAVASHVAITWTFSEEPLRGHKCDKSQDAPDFISVWAETQDDLEAELRLAILEAEEKRAACAEKVD